MDIRKILVSPAFSQCSEQAWTWAVAMVEKGLRHVLLGSIAERVVCYAPCPVLVVGKKAQV